MNSPVEQTLDRASLSIPRPRTASPRQGGMWLARLRVEQKLALIALAFGLPVTVLLTLFVEQQQKDIRFVRQELQGVQYLPTLAALQTQAWQYAQAVLALNNGTARAGTDARKQKLSDQIDAKLVALTALNRKFGGAQTQASLTDLSASWAALRDTAMQLSAPDLIKAHADFTTNQLQATLLSVANGSKLIDDPSLDAYYATDLSVNKLPNLRETLDATNMAAELAFAHNALPLSERVSLSVQTATAERLLQDALRSVQSAVDANPALSKSLGAAGQNLKNESFAYLQALRQLSGNGARVDPQGFREIAESASKAAQQLDETARNDLTALLHARSRSLAQSRTVSLVGVVGVLGLALLLLLTVARAITRPLAQLADATRALGQGDLDVSVPVRGSDEIGVVTSAFNDTVAQFRQIERHNAAEREAARLLQHNISAFLDVTMDIASGDLTKRGRVSEDVLGNVVDSINVMVEELERVLRSVQEASALVDSGASSMLITTDEIVQGAETTASAAQQVASEVQEVTSSIRDMAESAQQSAQTALLALNASQQGQDAVSSTLAGMQNIRREVQGIAKRIKGLGDRSLEIQEIVDTISRLTRQTNLLALNAAIEAAGAGEAGSRFAVVADEVRKLADSSAQATGRIAALIRTVQAEIQEVVVSVEDGTREVEAGYRVAGTAGERLGDIAQLAERSAQLAASISEATRAQVRGVEQVGSAAESIASVAARAQGSVLAGREAAERLRQLADNLTEQLSRFRLS